MKDMKDMKYPKINSLWKRDPLTKKLIPGEYSCDEFDNIDLWSVDEKIDGTNIRVIYKNGEVYFGGRTDDAQIPANLFQYLNDTFTSYTMGKAFPVEIDEDYPNVTLFGEGYGPKIQSGGGNYRKDVGFILFDVVIGSWWLIRENVANIAEALDIPMVPSIGIFKKHAIIEFVKSSPKSFCSVTLQVMEGVVCRPYPLMLFRRGDPIVWKLKCKDFN
jgi:ATP-dependent RNA circularization protein (DNA/RNA ligase family)